MLLRKIVEFKKEDTISMIGEIFERPQRWYQSVESSKCDHSRSTYHFIFLNSLLKVYLYFSKSMTRKSSLPAFANIESRLLDEKMDVKYYLDKET